MAIKFLAIASLLAATVLTPIHARFSDGKVVKPIPTPAIRAQLSRMETIVSPPLSQDRDAYLWVYLMFVYLFSGLAFYLLYTHTLKVIRVRQDYLGRQCTITDRTIHLTGIPRDMRSETAIKNHVERMGIGTVDSVTVCRDWKVLDDMMKRRDALLRKLEEAWCAYLLRRRMQQSIGTLPTTQLDLLPVSGTAEEPLLPSNVQVSPKRRRPTTTIWRLSFHYGIPHLSYKGVDAIDYYTIKLEALDKKIEETRKQEFRALSSAFVTLDSVAAAVSALSKRRIPCVILTYTAANGCTSSSGS